MSAGESQNPFEERPYTIAELAEIWRFLQRVCQTDRKRRARRHRVASAAAKAAPLAGDPRPAVGRRGSSSASIAEP